jgi:aspartate kinase
VDNLKRGGSDYTASLIAAAINASVCEIWTDIDGMHNNDPRIVDKTVAVEQLSFDEAAELAYFGAKILHPCMYLACTTLQCACEITQYHAARCLRVLPYRKRRTALAQKQ